MNRYLFKFKHLLIRSVKSLVSSNNLSIGEDVLLLNSSLKGKISIGDNCKVESSNLSGNISLKNNVAIHGTLLRGNIAIDSFSSITGPNTFLAADTNEIRIGKFCSIARRVSFHETNHPTNTYFTTKLAKKFNARVNESKQADNSKGSILIGNDVWIGTNATITSGVTVGNGVVIGANSVVTKDVPDYAIVGGCPAEVLKYRFNESTIRSLLKLEPWNLSKEYLIKNINIFDSEVVGNDIQKLLKGKSNAIG